MLVAFSTRAWAILIFFWKIVQEEVEKEIILTQKQFKLKVKMNVAQVDAAVSKQKKHKYL